MPKSSSLWLEPQPAPLLKCVLEFVTAQHDYTRKAYMNAAERLAESYDACDIREFADVQAVHVAAFATELRGSSRSSTGSLRGTSLT